MERLKKERTEARRRFTKAKNELTEILDAYKKDSQNYDALKISFTFLSQMAENLFDVDKRIQEQWLLEEDMDGSAIDYDSVDTYRKDWIRAEHECSKIISKVEHAESRYDSVSSKSVDYADKRRFRLPKLELTKFDGNAKNWLGFWSSFKKIHNDSNMDDDDKMAYLIQSMTEDSSALNLVKSFPPCGENYEQAVEQLKTRYARDELLVEIYVRELLSLVLRQTKENSPMKLSALYDKLKTQLRALELLGVTSEKYAAMLYPLVESALPAEMLRVWERQRLNKIDSESSSPDPLQSLLNFIKLEVESEERIQLTRQDLGSEETKTKVPTAACLVDEAKSPPPSSSSFPAKIIQCLWCDKTTHSSHECYKPQKMTLDERKALVNKKKACMICLRSGHVSKKCKSFAKCLVCQKKHAVLLCPDINKPQGETLANVDKNNSTTLLQTLIVKINGQTVRAFIDTGAQRSYIREDIVNGLGLKPKGEETLKHCLFGAVETKEECHKIYGLTVTNMKGDVKVEMTALGKNKICGYIPRVSHDTAICHKNKEKGLKLSDIGDKTPEIGLLIGADYAGKIATGSMIHLDKDLYAIQTKLGWTLQGIVAMNHDTVITTVGLTMDISQLWNLEVMGIEEPKDRVLRKRSEEETMKEFTKGVSINKEGRYEVELPWKIGKPDLLENRELAEKRLRSTSKRLTSLNEFQNYNKVFQEWLELGIIEEEPEVDLPGHYLPHHPVIKESSLTTRVRPVFDASAKDYNGNSINGCLETGQNFLELIPILLIRFRMHAVGLTADIKKAFLQISIAEKDRRYLRFLWWTDEGSIIVYRHCRVVFGLTCSPFLLAATLIFHLERYTLSKYGQSAELLENSFYVDNCVASLSSQQEAERFISEAKQLLLEGKFELRGWVTAPIQCEGTEKQTMISVLGMIWDTEKDDLRCNINSVRNCKDPITKRELLSVCNRVFDPIGVTSPTTLIPKLLLQKTWSLNIGWDEKLPNELCQEFKKWLEEIHLLHNCCIPRTLTVKPIKETQISLHVFSDASKDAYATCIFLRSESDDGVHVQLVSAKARVTPVKEITMPRLELIAALMSTRLYIQVCDALRLENYKAFFWSDSSIVVTWIVTKKEWSVFVKNRVREITETTRREDWRHISGSLNPADLPSRGCSAKKLIESRWWEGPTWLKESEDKWPASLEILVKEEEIDEELKPKAVMMNANTLVENFTDIFKNISKYTRVVRTFAWVLRFIEVCRSKGTKTSGVLTLEELNKSEKTLLQIVQRESFTEKEKLRGMKNLETLTGVDNLIRVKTRLTLSDDEEDQKRTRSGRVIKMPNRLDL